MIDVTLRARILILFVFTLLTSSAVAFVLYEMYELGATSQVSKAKKLNEYVCEELKDKFDSALTRKVFDQSKETAFQSALLEIVLSRHEGVEGGFWSEPKGFLAYAYPTYEGSGIKTDVPSAERAALEKISKLSLASSAAQSSVHVGRRNSQIISACSTQGASSTVAIWTMSRVATVSGATSDNSRTAFNYLLAFLIFIASSGILLLLFWNQSLRKLEKTLVLKNQQALSAEKEAEAKFSRERRLSALGRMAAGFAHELRNPLAVVRLKFENLLVDPNSRAAAAAPLIFEQISRIDKLVELMLQSAQPFILNKEKIQLKAWFVSNSIECQRQAEAKHVSLIYSVEDLIVEADPFHLSRAIENLITNAISFSPEGSRVSIEAHRKENSLEIEIADSGKGISEKVKANLFEAFVSDRSGGTGLGLSLARDIIEAHGGRLDLAPSRPNSEFSGARFVIQLPLSSETKRYEN